MKKNKIILFSLIVFIMIYSVFISCARTSIKLNKETFELSEGVIAKINESNIEIFSQGKDFVVFPLNNSFINAFEKEITYEYHMASINIKEKIKKSFINQEISSIKNSDGILLISGFIFENIASSEKIPYIMKITAENRNKINIEISVDNNKVNSIKLKYISYKDEYIFGGGIQYSFLNLKGKKVPMLTSEQGVGRGDQPITFGANLTQKAGGDNFTTYCPIPFFLTSNLRSFYFENSGYGVFDFSNSDIIDVEFLTSSESNKINCSFYKEDSYLSLISAFAKDNGKMPELPDWSYGTILGIQGGSQKVIKVLDSLIEAGNPIKAIWIQDWCGRRVTSFGDQLKWRWYPDENLYPDFKNFVKTMESKGVKVLGYINPFLADKDPKKTDDDFSNPLLEEAIKQDLLVKDKSNKPYLIQTVGFPAYLLDLTNPKTIEWIKKIIKTNMIDNGLSGWMADFGEWMPMDAVLYSGESAATFHNKYPTIWAQINREAIIEANKEGQILFFTRAGFSKSAKYSTLFWLGDQMVSFGLNDGLASAILGTITASISGIPFIHSDVGGYTTITNPIMTYHRSKELLLRWMEFEAFTPIFRTHEGNQPLNNWQVYQYSDEKSSFKSDDETTNYYTFYSKIHFNLAIYFKPYIELASKTGIPVIRALFLNYPNDKETYKIKYQFMVGEGLLVAPIIKEKAKKIKLYLPEGKWMHVFSKKIYEGKRYIEIDAPIGMPAVFILMGGKDEKLFEDVFNIKR